MKKKQITSGEHSKKIFRLKVSQWSTLAHFLIMIKKKKIGTSFNLISFLLTTDRDADTVHVRTMANNDNDGDQVDKNTRNVWKCLLQHNSGAIIRMHWSRMRERRIN